MGAQAWLGESEQDSDISHNDLCTNIVLMHTKCKFPAHISSLGL